MNATLDTFNAPSPVASGGANKPLWAAVGVLGVCVLAMGSALVHISSSKPQDANLQAFSSASAIPLNNLSSSLQALSVPAVATAPALDKPVSDKKPANISVKSSYNAPKSGVNTAPTEKSSAPVLVASSGSAPVASPAHTPAPTPAAEPAARTPTEVQYTPAPTPVQVAQPVAKPICGSCGVVESVTPMVRKGEAGAVGTIAGGVLGAVLGNQVGQGTGKDVATILGGVGGVFAGREIEKNVKKTTVYNVQVRMEDGSLRSFEQPSSMAVGAKVTVESGVLRAG